MRGCPLPAPQHKRLVLGQHPSQDVANQQASRRQVRQGRQRVGPNRIQGSATAGRFHADGWPRGGAVYGGYQWKVA